MTARPKKLASLAMKVSDAVLARAKERGRRIRSGQPQSPFDPAASLHPPGVVPKGIATVAMDSSVAAPIAWASGLAFNSAFSEGVTFLGYSYLAELTQRPEYRRISETIARHMTRKWIKLKSKGDEDKSDRIAVIEAALIRFGVKDAFYKVAEQDGFFGRAHLYLDFGTTDDREELKTPIGDGHGTISRAKVKKGSLKRIKPVEAVWCYPTSYDSNDPLKPDWYRPTSWFVMGKQLHASRFLTFIGREVPDLLKPAYSFGGLSLSQMAKPYVDNWLGTRQSVSDIISAFSVFVLKTNLVDSMNSDGDQLFKRAELFNALRDNRGLMMIDKEREEFANVSASLATLDVLQAQSQEHMASVSGIPLVELLGIQPAGLNATSEGEIKVFDDWIHSCQETLFRPNLTRIIGFVQLSEFGDVDPDITFDFEPLRTLDDKEKAEVQKMQAETDAVMIESGEISVLEGRKRLAADPDSEYNGIEVEDLPVMPDPADVLPDPPNPERVAEPDRDAA